MFGTVCRGWATSRLRWIAQASGGVGQASGGVAQASRGVAQASRGGAAHGIHTHVVVDRATYGDPSPPLVLVAAGHGVPAPLKDKNQDAMVVEADAGFLCVLDGVGGWTGVPGADPAEFTSRLADALREAATTATAPEPNTDADTGADAEVVHGQARRVVGIVERAMQSLDVATLMLGSSTVNAACLGPDNDGALHVYNLGDSEARVLSRESRSEAYRVIVSTQNGPSSQLQFNFPYQIGRNGHKVGDGSLYSIPLVRGDIVLLTSDGVHDNLFDEDLESVINAELGEVPLLGLNTPELVDVLENAAMRLVSDARYFAGSDRPSPFSEHGGKPDDTTAILAVVR